MYTLHFHHLHIPGRGFAFPCTSDGTLISSEMTRRMWDNHYTVTTQIGVTYTMPEIVFVGEPAVL